MITTTDPGANISEFETAVDNAHLNRAFSILKTGAEQIDEAVARNLDRKNHGESSDYAAIFKEMAASAELLSRAAAVIGRIPSENLMSELMLQISKAYHRAGLCRQQNISEVIATIPGSIVTYTLLMSLIRSGDFSTATEILAGSSHIAGPGSTTIKETVYTVTGFGSTAGPEIDALRKSGAELPDYPEIIRDSAIRYFEEIERSPALAAETADLVDSLIALVYYNIYRGFSIDDPNPEQRRGNFYIPPLKVLEAYGREDRIKRISKHRDKIVPVPTFQKDPTRFDRVLDQLAEELRWYSIRQRF